MPSLLRDANSQQGLGMHPHGRVRTIARPGLQACTDGGCAAQIISVTGAVSVPLDR